MKIGETYYSADEGDFQRELVGKRIVVLTESTVILDDGTVLQIKDGNPSSGYYGSSINLVVRR